MSAGRDRFSRIDFLAVRRNSHSLFADEGILSTCYDWGLLIADGICQLVLRYQRKTHLNQVLMHRIKLRDSGKAEIVMLDRSK